jgi:DNA-binding MarR family transcriptional regulator
MIIQPLAYPDGPGHRGVDTCIAAADAIASSLGRLQRVVLNAIRSTGIHGATTNELADRLKIDRGSVQPRTSELRRQGLIIDSGRRRPNANGKSAIVWLAVTGGDA